MRQIWLSSVLPIAAIFSFRMLGLFMLIPIFTVFAAQLHGATPPLIGLALGSYGLSQGILQIPFGMLSDRFGRKPIITLGLLFFACGSLIGALSNSIYTMILARILQGMGAIGSVLIALLADLTTDAQRTRAMAVIGVTIGLSFSFAMVLSPALTNQYGLSSIFYFTVGLALMGLVLLHTVIPAPKKNHCHLDSKIKPSLLKTVIHNKQLQRLNYGIFFQHLILTATFYVIPLALRQEHFKQQWHFYLPLMFFSFLLMIPFILFAEKKQQMKRIFLMAVFAVGIVQILLAFGYHHWLSLCSLMFIYFTAFNFLEASLPSLISKQASTTTKGTAMGVYSSSQFLGIFVGGVVAGFLKQFVGNEGIFIANAIFAFIWLFVSYPMEPG